MRRLDLIFGVGLLLGYGSLYAQNGAAISNGASISNGAALVPGNPCVITTNSLPPGTDGVFYDQTLQTANCIAPLNFSVVPGSGAFPGWATLNPLTGEISGTPFSGSFSFTLQLVDATGTHAFFAPTFNIAASSNGDPLPPDTALSAWDFSQAGTPTGTTVLCVGTPINAALLPGGGCASSFAGTTAGFQAALNAMTCGSIVNVAALSAGVTIQYGALTLPHGLLCTPTTYWWVTGDLSDTAMPADGVRPDPSYIGIPANALSMTMYSNTYPTVNLTPNVATRHFPQIIVPGAASNHCFSFNAPNSGANTPSTSYFRIQHFECTRDQNGDSVTSLIDLGWQPGQNVPVILTDPTMDCGSTVSGSTGQPSHADKCMADQPNHGVISQNIIHGDSQRQTVRGLAMGGGQFIAVVNNYGYDIQDSFAGGDGDAQFVAGGFGKSYTGVGNWVFDNNFTASSSEGTIFCGAFSEPQSPVTGKDGTPTSVIWNHAWFYKPVTWDTQRGQATGETLVNEGVTYPPQGDQEQVFNPTAFQVQQGLSMSLNNTWLNDSAGGWNRFNDSNGTGTVTVDGTDYKTVTSANGIITKANITVGSSPWQEVNIIQWIYTACLGNNNPAGIGCTTATTAGNHSIVFNGLVTDGRAATLGNDRHLITTITATVTAGAPTKQIFITPSAPDLQIQPSYSDSFNNNRNFAYPFQAITNFSNTSMSWTVDGVANGNATVGRICSVTAVPCTGPASNDARVVYVSGTGLGSHTIAVVANTGTTTSQAITVSKTSPVWAYDLKAMTVKNMWEAKCVNRAILHFSLLENTHGSNGNGGGQNTCMLLQPANNANQVLDGNGVNVGYGPMNDSDVLVDHVHTLHSGGGLIIAGLGVAKGIHRIKFQHVLMEDFNCVRWSHGFKYSNPLFCNFEQFSGDSGTALLPWTSLATPLTDNIKFDHIGMVGSVNSWLSIANNKAQFQLGPFSITNSYFGTPNSTPFFNNNGEANDCGTNQTVGKKESTQFLGTGNTPFTPCFSGYSLANNLLLDSTAASTLFLTPTIWQKLPTDPDVFLNYGGGNGGDYHFKPGSIYLAGGSRQATDGTAIGPDIDGIAASDAIVRRGAP